MPWEAGMDAFHSPGLNTQIASQGYLASMPKPFVNGLDADPLRCNGEGKAGTCPRGPKSTLGVEGHSRGCALA